MTSHRFRTAEEARFGLGSETDASMLFAELARPLDHRMVHDGLRAFTERMASPTYLRTMASR